MNDSDDGNNDEILPSFRIYLLSILPAPYHTTFLHAPCSLVAMTAAAPQTFSFMLSTFHDLSTFCSFYPFLPHFIKQTLLFLSEGYYLESPSVRLQLTLQSKLGDSLPSDSMDLGPFFYRSPTHATLMILPCVFLSCLSQTVGF